MEENSRKSEIFSDNPGKFDKKPEKNRLAKGFWTPISDVFFDLRLNGILSPIDFSNAMMLLRYCNKKNLKFNFEMSRRELAKISGCGERQAGLTLDSLVRHSLLRQVFKLKGCHSKYAWNVDNFQDHISNLYLWDTGTCTSGVQDLYPGGTGPVPTGYNTCIDFIVNTFLIRLEHLKLENVDNFYDAPDGASVYDFTVASWTDAIGKCSRAFGYNRVHLIIKNHAVDYFQVHEASKELRKLCLDSSLVSGLTTMYGCFKSDKEFAFYVEKNMGRVVRELLTLDPINKDLHSCAEN